MTATVAQMIDLLDQLAPPQLAETWDNVGLQIGDHKWPVKKVWTALDPLHEVVAAACDRQVDLLITHHPLFFKPLKQIDCASPAGRITEMALSSKMAIVCAHTNLDSAQGGLNDLLAERMGVKELGVLGDAVDAGQVKLVVFTPASHLEAVRTAIFAHGGGVIGNYTCCSYQSDGQGTFLPGAEATPAVGATGQLNEVAEIRIETVVPVGRVGRLVEAVEKVHPYETMAYDIYPLANRDPSAGLGRVGQLAEASTLGAFAHTLKERFGLEALRIVGAPEMPVQTVAICSGSGSSLLPAAIAAGAQVYVSGDLGYHTARDAQQAGLGLVDMGHFGSEHPIVDVLATRLQTAARDAGLTVVVEANDMETDPFVAI